MSTSKIADVDNPVLKETWHYDAENDKLICEKSQDIEHIVKANREAQADFDGHYGSERVVARIPVVVRQWLIDNKGIDIMNCEEKDLMRLLNDPDFQHLRTVGGTL